MKRPAKIAIYFGAAILLANVALLAAAFYQSERQEWEQAEEIYVEELTYAQDVLSEVFGKDWNQSTLNAAEVTVTAYQSKPEQTDSTPWETASGQSVLTGRIAVSRDLNIPFGTIVHLKGYGSFVIADRMNARFTKSVDIWTGIDNKSVQLHGTQKTTMLWLEEK